MRHFFGTALSQQLGQLKTNEAKMVFYSCLYFFCLLCSYFILRPLRDEMGIVNGAQNMQWLFTGTLLAMLCAVPLFGLLVSKNSIKRVLVYSYSFFIGNILLFYILFESFGITKILSVAFFIWLSVFNLFVVSLFWSFMADVFSCTSSKRFFGIIASGGSLGALTGPIVAKHLSTLASINILLLTAAFFLMIALLCIFGILRLSPKKAYFNRGHQNPKVGIKNLFEGIQKIVKSPYLLGIVIFVLFYTSISTVLYFEQAHLVESTLTDSMERISYFSNLDFTVNALSIMGQFFLTAKIIRRMGLSMVLASIPFLMGIGLVLLGLHPTLGTMALLLILHRSGNFMLLRPGREILFTVTSVEEKYKAKNFIDTAIYRSGDALVAWAFSAFMTVGMGLGAIAFLAVPISLLWGFTGFRLGALQSKMENTLPLKHRIYENNAQP
ncbi:MAG: MFS transporter [Allomuricauda sp.]